MSDGQLQNRTDTILMIQWLQVALFSMILHIALEGLAAELAYTGMIMGGAGMLVSVVKPIGAILQRRIAS